MDFKLNGFEKFMIRYRIPIIRITGLIYIIGMIISAILLIPFGAPLLLAFFFLTLQVYMFVILKKINQPLVIRNKHLQPEKALDATNQLIETTSEKNIQDMAVLLNNRAAFLINMGEFEQAECEIRMFWQKYGNKKLANHIRVAIHTNMATIALEKKDFKSYEEQFRIICEYENKKAKKLIKRQMKHSIISLTQSAEAVIANENSNFEEYATRVWQTNQYDPLRDRNLTGEQVLPYSYLNVYENLFIFTHNQGDVEKAKNYAQQIVNIGNEQFYIYRKAKEYLENGNSSN